MPGNLGDVRPASEGGAEDETEPEGRRDTSGPREPAPGPALLRLCPCPGPRAPRPAPTVLRCGRRAWAADAARRRPGKTLPRCFPVQTSLPRTRTPRTHDRGEQCLPLPPVTPASWFGVGRDLGPRCAVAAGPESLVSYRGAEPGSLVTSRWRGRDGGRFPQARRWRGEPPVHPARSLERGAPQRRAPSPVPLRRRHTRLCARASPRALTAAQQLARRSPPTPGAVSPGSTLLGSLHPAFLGTAQL